jgi:hypothetical protein
MISGIIFDRPRPTRGGPGTRDRSLWRLSGAPSTRTPANLAGSVELVVDQLAVVQAPRLVELVVFVARDVGHLTAVAGVGEEEEVAGLDRRRAGGEHGLPRGFLRQRGQFHLAGLGERLHVLGVELAGVGSPLHPS